MKNNKCFKCGIDEHIIVHHLSYEPEKLVFCCRRCHKYIHNKIRKQNLCPISIKEVARLSINSANRRSTRKINFRERICKNIQFLEQIQYNINSGEVYFYSGFEPTKGKELYYL